MVGTRRVDAWEDPSAAAENVDAVLQAFAQREQSWPFVALVRALDTVRSARVLSDPPRFAQPTYFFVLVAS